MRTVAFTNHKGGSSKTTSAVNVAAALGEAQVVTRWENLAGLGSVAAYYPTSHTLVVALDTTPHRDLARQLLTSSDISLGAT